MSPIVSVLLGHLELAPEFVGSLGLGVRIASFGTPVVSGMLLQASTFYP